MWRRYNWLSCVVVALLLAGCTPQPVAKTGAPPKAPKLTGQETKGQVAMLARQYCGDLAEYQCPGFGRYCTGYQRVFIRSCMIKVGIPPEYVIALTY